MKKKMSKLLLALIVLSGFAVSVLGGNFDTEAADESPTYVVENYTADVASTYFKNNTAPTCKTDGYIFAGWYAEDDTVITDETTGEEYFTGSPIVTLVGYMHENVKALFVEGSVLDVKGQIAILDNDDGTADDGNINVATVTDTTKANLRLITSVDSLKYQKVGFEISYAYGETPVSTGSVTNYVYKNLTVVDGTDGAADEKMVPSEVFSKRSQYFKACTVNGVPKDAFDTDFSVRAYWVTADGATVYGSSTPISKSVQAGIYHTYEAGVSTTYYQVLEDAVGSVAASEAEATVTLFKDAEVESDMEITGIVKVTNREGADVTVYRSDSLTKANIFSVTSGGTLTIEGTTDENSIILDGQLVSGVAMVNLEEGKLNTKNLTMKNSIGNTEFGAAVYAQSGTLTATNVLFINNSGECGAAIRMNIGITQAEITGCVFGKENSGNTVTADGGAVYNLSDYVTIVDSEFCYNSALNGGAIRNNAGTMTVKNTKFAYNTAEKNGGAIQSNGSGVKSVFHDKNDSGNNALAIFIGNKVTDGSVKTNGGGVINMTGGTLTITGYRFEANYSAKLGGAIRTNGGTRTITDSTFVGNYTTGDSGYGGAIYINGSGTAKITNTTFDGNYTNGNAAHGGAIYKTADATKTTLTNVNYLNNVVTGSGSEGADLYEAK